MNRQDLLEVVEHVIAELKDANRTTPIVVEGERDEKCLRKLGFSGEIFRMNIGLSILNFCERLTDFNEVIILTDFDRKGVELRQKLAHALFANGIKPNDNYWLGLKHLCSREIKEIEHLHIFVSNLRK